MSSIPVRIPWRTRIRRVACGWWHSALVTDAGALWTWGCGQQSQLGHGDSNSRSKPTLVNLDHLCADMSAEQQSAGLAVADVSLGWTHSLALVADGRVIVFGTNQAGIVSQSFHSHQRMLDNQHLYLVLPGSLLPVLFAGQLGTLDEKTRPIPTWLPLSVESMNADGASAVPIFAAVSAGWKHSAFLTRDGRVFVCGSNQRGQCGRTVASSARATSKSAPSSASGSAASGDDTELPSVQRSSRPLPIMFEHQSAAEPVCIRALSSGWHHLLFLGIATVAFLSCSSRVFCHQLIVPRDNRDSATDRNGEVWSLGRNDFGQCGLGHFESPVTKPQRVTLPTGADDGSRACSVRCGSEHGVIITDRGAICVFGWNEHGNLGIGDAANRCVPVWVPHPSGGLLRVCASQSGGVPGAASSSQIESAPCLAVGGAAMLVMSMSNSE